MNHALQAVHLTNIVKADFKTDTLALRRGAPSSFDQKYLYIFVDQVLRPLWDRLCFRNSELLELRRTQLQFIKNETKPSFTYPGLYKDETEEFSDAEAMRIFYEDVFRDGTLGH